MRNSCVFFEINQKKYGFETKDILHVEPAVAVVKDPGMPESILGYVNVGGVFGPVYDLVQIMHKDQPVVNIQPEHYFLILTNDDNQIAAIRLLDVPSFENCDIIEFERSNNQNPLRVARLKDDMVMLLTSETFIESHEVDEKLQQRITAFENLIHHDIKPFENESS